MPSDLTLGKKRIGEHRPLFVIAEAGVTCNYDLRITRELIDVVAASGADAIKFIFWFPEEILSDRSATYTYETLDGPRTENLYEMLSKLRFSLDEWRQVKSYADEKGVILFCTVNSPSGIGYAEALGLEAYKLSSWDYNYLPLWRKIAALGKPMLIDTGPVNTLEVAKVMQVLREAGNDRHILLHCFHTNQHSEFNMRAIPYMRAAFNTLVGFSARDRQPEPDVMAVSLGACVLEKRLTLSRRLPGHHHAISLEPQEFTAHVRRMREVQAALGVHDLRPSPGDLAARRGAFRRLVANRAIPKGSRLTLEMLEGKRPEEGVSPEHLERFVGRVVKRDLAENEPLRWEDV